MCEIVLLFGSVSPYFCLKSSEHLGVTKPQNFHECINNQDVLLRLYECSNLRQIAEGTKRSRVLGW